MDNKEIDNLKSIFAKYPEVQLVYFFGSRARNDAGPLGDYDLAVFLNPAKDRKQMIDTRMTLQAEIAKLLKTDKIDLVILNLVLGLELKFNIIKEGKIIFERDAARVFVEPRILNEYFDFKALLKRYNLTKA